MKYLLIIYCVFGFAFYSNSQTLYSGTVEEKIKEVEQTVSLSKFQIEGKPNATLQERMAYYHVKGLSIAVIHNYRVEWAKGYGWADSAEQRPVTTETLFEPGSISKSLNAFGVLKLVQDKKLDLNKDINTYLSSWKFPYDSVSKNKKITLFNLLSHTAGLGVHGFPGYFKGDAFPTLPEILDGKKPANTAAVRSLFEPGLKVEYSGGGTMISQLIEMDITQQPYDTYMFENVLAPIGMMHSSFTQPPPENKRKLLATGYTVNGVEIKGKYPILLEQAAGGLWTTPTDLCQFVIEVQLSLQGKSNKVLSKELIRKMLTPSLHSSAGLGFFIDDVGGARYFQHSAGNQGFSGQYYGSFEDGNGLAVVVNTDNGGSIIQEIVMSVANAYQWKGFYTGERPVTKKVVQVNDTILNTYVGIYKQQTTITTITKSGNELMYHAGAMPWKMYFTSATEFFNLESKSEKTFYSDPSGKVKGFSKKVEDKEFGTSEKITLAVVADSLLEKYAGSYMDGENVIKILMKDKSLWLDPGYDQPLMKLNFLAKEEFYVEEDFGAVYKFTCNNSGIYTSILGKSGENEKILKRIK